MKTTIFVSGIVLIMLVNLASSTVINIPADYATIQQGINASVDGDTVLVQPGMYSENIVFSGHSIVVTSNYLLTGNTEDIDNTIIDGGGISSTVSIQNGEYSNTRIIGLSITNGLGTGSWPNVRGGGIHVSNGAQPNIEFCYIYNNFTTGTSNRGAGIYANSPYSQIRNCVIFQNESLGGPGIAIGNDATGVVVEECELYENVSTHPSPTAQSTILIGYSSGVTISNTLIHDNIGTGIRNFGSSGTNVDHCTISNNTAFGIYNIYFSSDITVRNSILAFNNENNVENNTNNGMYNCWILCEYSDIIGGTGEDWFDIGCIDNDPLFVGGVPFDYYLTENSPCIDAGDPGFAYDPDGTITDMGVYYFDQMTDIEIEAIDTPALIALSQSYPNPFNAQTTFEYALPEASHVTIEIYDLLGRHIETLVDAEMPAGYHQATWDARDQTSGMYFYKIQAGEFTETKKMTLLK